MHLAPEGRHVYSCGRGILAPISMRPSPKTPVALNPDLSGRDDMSLLSESQIARMIAPISSRGLAFKIVH